MSSFRNSSFRNEKKSLRLPLHVKPIEYHLALKVDFTHASQNRDENIFDGDVNISIDVTKPTKDFLKI